MTIVDHDGDHDGGKKKRRRRTSPGKPKDDGSLIHLIHSSQITNLGNGRVGFQIRIIVIILLIMITSKRIKENLLFEIWLFIHSPSLPFLLSLISSHPYPTINCDTMIKNQKERRKSNRIGSQPEFFWWFIWSSQIMDWTKVSLSPSLPSSSCDNFYGSASAWSCCNSCWIFCSTSPSLHFILRCRQEIPLKHLKRNF